MSTNLQAEVERLVSGTTIDCRAAEVLMEKLCQRFLCTFSAGFPSLHVGLGNPNASTLIVGHELAINLINPNPTALKKTPCNSPGYYKKLFLNEVFLNYFLWQAKAKGLSIAPNCCLQDPQFPAAFCGLYNEEKPPGHTWKLINKMVQIKKWSLKADDLNDKQIKKELSQSFKTRDYRASFFHQVFLTELNALPSLRSNQPLQGPLLLQKLGLLFTLPFFARFNRIILACHRYLKEADKNYATALPARFRLTPVALPGDTTDKIKAVYQKGRKRIVVCTQLSGSNAWSNDELCTLAGYL